MLKSLLALVFLFVAATAQAQTPVVNPTTVTFDSADHAAIDSYNVGYFASATATAPVQEGTIGKPATCSPCTASILASRPTMFTNWWIGARAIAGAVTSPWSAPLVPFVRAPAAPTNVLAK